MRITATLARITPENQHKIHAYIQKNNGYPLFDDHKKWIGKVKSVYIESNEIKGILELNIMNISKLQAV